jgi:hypothetical protein
MRTKKKAAAISTKPPLQFVVLRDKRDADMAPFEEAVERALEGGPHTSGYIASGEDLGAELRKFDRIPRLRQPLAKIIAGACHTVLIALVADACASDKGWREFLGKAWSYVQANPEHSLLLFARDETIARKLLTGMPALDTNMVIAVDQLAERALRAGFVALRVLHEARSLLAAALPGSGANFLTLFISHAKLDGLPLAQSLKHVIHTMPWLRSFYDARDLSGVTAWQTALEKAAKSSLLIILRTDNYEQRPWCQKESLWAEEAAAPTVLVEARPGLAYPAGELPLERMPSVRIPDGNLYRILHAALRESVRHLLFQRRVQEMRSSGRILGKGEVIALSYPPSMSALLRVCQTLKSKNGLIIYPDPPLRRGLYEAAIALMDKVAPHGAKLLTPTMLGTVGTTF